MSFGTLYVPNDGTGPQGIQGGYWFGSRLYRPMDPNNSVQAYPLSTDGTWPLAGVRQVSIHPKSEVRAIRLLPDINGGLPGAVDLVEGSVVAFPRLTQFYFLDRLDAHDGKLLLQWTQSSERGALLRCPVETHSKLSIVLPAGFLAAAGKSLYMTRPRQPAAGRMNSFNYAANREMTRYFAVATQTAGVLVNQTVHPVCSERVSPYAPVVSGQAARANFFTFGIAAGAQTVLGGATNGVPNADPADGVELRFPLAANGAIVANYEISH